MTAILKTMHDMQVKGKQALREEFFALIRKPNPTEEDALHLRHVINELGWDEKLIKVIGEVFRTAESLEAEIKQPSPPQDSGELSAELAKLVSDFNELAKEATTRRTALEARIFGTGRFQAKRQQDEQLLRTIREKFVADLWQRGQVGPGR